MKKLMINQKIQRILEFIKKNFSKRILLLVQCLFVAKFLWVAKKIWANMNLLQVDVAGHISSARAFREGYFHLFYDNFFQGNIHNLFYTPLEDFVITLISFVTGGNLVIAFRIYLTLVVLALLLIFLYFIKNFKTNIAKIFFLIFISTLLFASKSGHLEAVYMGLSWYDMFEFGLTNQFLGFAFFILLVDGLINKKNWKILTLLLSLTAMSHLVMGIAAFSVVITFSIIKLDKSLLKTTLFSLGLISFFIVPFMFYREYMVSNNLYRSPHNEFLMLLALLLVTFNLKDKFSALVVSALVIVIPTFLNFFEFSSNLVIFLPNTHYERFLIISSYLIIIYISFLIDVFKKLNNQQKYSLYLALILLAMLVYNFSKYSLPTEDPMILKNVEIKNTEGRIHTLAPHRVIDFYLDNYLVANGHDLVFTRGLFSESTRNNTILYSYFSSLYTTDGMFLYFHYVREPDCEKLKFIHDKFIDDYAINKLIVSTNDGYNLNLFYNISPDRKACLSEMLENGSERYGFNKIDYIETNKDIKFSIFEVISKEENSRNRMVQVIENGAIQILYSGPWGFMPATHDIYFNNSEITNIFLRRGHPDLPKNFTQEEVSNVSFRKIGRAKYEIFIDSDIPVFFKIKLNYFPGFTLKDSEGNRLNINDGSHFILAEGKGRMILQYRRTNVMKFGYLLSALVLILFLKVCFKRK